MTRIDYNGVTINNALTRSFGQRCVYDDSNTDLVLHKFNLQFTGHISIPVANQTPAQQLLGVQLDGAIVNSAPALAIQQIRARLLQPRYQFVMTVGQDQILNVIPGEVLAPTNGTSQPWGDVDNGPKPIRCDIAAIYGTSLFKFEYEIEMSVVECGDRDGNNSSGVLSNRWSWTEVWDQDYYRHRTIQGRLRGSNGAVPASAYRLGVFPPLENGFARKSINLVSDRSGLVLDYTIEDEEMYAAPPFGATTWEASSTINMTEVANITEEFAVMLKGPKSVKRIDLVNAAQLITAQRLDLYQRQRVDENGNKLKDQYFDKPIVMGGSIIDYLHENKVEMRTTVRRMIQSSQSKAIMMLPVMHTGLHLDDPLPHNQQQSESSQLGYNHELAPLPQNYYMQGTTELEISMFANYLQSPCSRFHAVTNEAGQATVVVPIPDSSYRLPASSQTAPPEINTSQTQLDLSEEADDERTEEVLDGAEEQGSGIYTHYEINNTYKTEQNTIQVPIAKSMAATEDTGSEAQTQQNTATAAFIDLAPPTVKRVVEVTAVRFGSPPKMPKPEEFSYGDQQIVPIGESSLQAMTPEWIPSGDARRFEMKTSYEYGLMRPPRDDESLQLGKLPYDKMSSEQNTVPPEVFDRSSELIPSGDNNNSQNINQQNADLA